MDHRVRFAYLPLGALSPDPSNPRVHTPDQVRAIARSIEAFGFNAPILITDDNRIVAGHGRFEAARLLGVGEVPVIRLSHLSGAQRRAYMMADNKLTDRSSWNDRELAQQLKELQEIVLDFDIEATGFEPPEIDLRVQSLEPAETLDAADEFDPPEGDAVSRIGDLWSLGEHRLLCGNALEGPSYAALLQGEAAAAVFTDPPYNVRVNGHASGKGRTKHREFAMASGEMNEEEFTAFLLAWMALAGSQSVKSAVFFMCMDWRHMAEATSAIAGASCELINLCVWVKSNGGMGTLYRSRHELVLVFRARGAQHLNNVQLGRFGRNRTNVWHYPGMNIFAPQGRMRGTDIHPTVKPIRLVVDAILDVTKPGDLVLDPFCGSGTTLLAAERTGRRGYGIELDPLYVDLAIRRWQRMSGQQARLKDGKAFNDVSAERAATEGAA